jgi:Fic family protein
MRASSRRNVKASQLPLPFSESFAPVRRRERRVREHRRNRQVVRELQMLLTLERARVGLTLREMAAAFRVTDRTIRRDLEALQEAGVPVIELEEHRWRVMNWRNRAA